MARILLSTILITFSLFFSSVTVAASNRVSFTISVQDIRSDLKIMTVSVMPENKLRIRTVANAVTDSGKLVRNGRDWIWTAPLKPGLAVLNFSHASETMVLNVFVMTPFTNTKQESLNGFRIGRYATSLFRGLSSYAAPKGLIEIGSAPDGLKVSPNFTLKQFICKQQPGHDPSYMLLRPAMLVKLERLLEAANARGWEADTFFVMSGFRTPYYNKAIGNDTTSSRHLYGGAADIWIDHDGDGTMDDLNGDGKIDTDDARELAKLANSLTSEGNDRWPSGGIGIYSANAAHGPFVHIDARGYRARWGQ